MPIEYHIDHDRRVIIAKGKGAFTSEDMFQYQLEAWSEPGVAGYNELVDMTDVTEIVNPSVENIRRLVELSAKMDPPDSNARFAIAAPSKLMFGLGRMYEAYRELQPQSTKVVRVFKTVREAMDFLGLEEEKP
jgi:hypothetical protein